MIYLDYVRQRILPGNITVEIFFNELIDLIEQNDRIRLDLSLCDQAYLTAQRCAKRQCITHTSMKNLAYHDQFQAEVRSKKSFNECEYQELM